MSYSTPAVATSKSFDVLDLGLCNYRECLGIQQNLFRDISLGNRRSSLVFCEHSPVITLGRAGKRENILKSEDELKKIGIEIFNITRGGDVTLHLPGQLVAYPIFDLRLFGKDIRKFLNNLEEVTILLLEDYGIRANIREGLTGVWVGNRKIASVGIAISRWVSWHGLSLNVNCDLNLFSLIRPCGQDIMMTSLKQLIGQSIGTYPRINRREGGTVSRAEARREDDGVAEGALRRGRTTQTQAEKLSSLPMSDSRIGSDMQEVKTRLAKEFNEVFCGGG